MQPSNREDIVNDNPAVLVLVNDADERDAVRRRLIEIDVIPLIVRADRATAAVERFHPVAAVLDDAHAAVATADFLAMTSVHRVRLLTLPRSEKGGGQRCQPFRGAKGRDHSLARSANGPGRPRGCVI